MGASFNDHELGVLLSRILSVFKKPVPANSSQTSTKQALTSSYSHALGIKEFTVPLPYKDEMKNICFQNSVIFSFASESEDETSVTFYKMKLESNSWARIATTVESLNKLNSWDRQSQDSQNAMFRELSAVYNDFVASLVERFGKATIKSEILPEGELDVRHDPNLNRVTFSRVAIKDQHRSALDALIRQYPDVQVQYKYDHETYRWSPAHPRIDKFVLTGDDTDALLASSKQALLYLQVRHIKEAQKGLEEKQREAQLLKEKDEAYLKDFAKEVDELLSSN
jgi:hypothetical protein